MCCLNPQDPRSHGNQVVRRNETTESIKQRERSDDHDPGSPRVASGVEVNLRVRGHVDEGKDRETEEADGDEDEKDDDQKVRTEYHAEHDSTLR